MWYIEKKIIKIWEYVYVLCFQGKKRELWKCINVYFVNQNNELVNEEIYYSMIQLMLYSLFVNVCMEKMNFIDFEIYVKG